MHTTTTNYGGVAVICVCDRCVYFANVVRKLAQEGITGPLLDHYAKVARPKVCSFCGLWASRAYPVVR